MTPAINIPEDLLKTSEKDASSNQESSISPLSDIYIITWKDRSFLVTKHFYMNSSGDKKRDKALAITRAQQFCTRTGFRFVHCEPFLVSLEEIESRMQY